MPWEHLIGDQAGRHHVVSPPSDPSGPVPSLTLTMLGGKHERFLADPYYLESCEDLVEVAGQDAHEVAIRSALLLLKPDAVVRHTLTEAVDWLAGRGWVVAAVQPVRLTRWVLRGLWGYQWPTVDRDRREMADLYLPATDSLLLVLRGPDESAWAARTLTQQKGHFDAARCGPGTLRFHLGSLNRQLNLVHSSDEPADVVRELGVCLDGAQRRAIYSALVAGRDVTDEARRSAARLQEREPALDLTLSRCLHDLDAGLDGLGGEGHTVDELRHLLREMGAGRSRDWRGVLRSAAALGLPVSRWQVVVLGTSVLSLPPVDGRRPAHPSR